MAGRISVIPDRDTNPGIEAIGLDAASLVGQTTAEIRSRLGSADLALILPDEPIPEGWPAGILYVDPAENLLTWYFLISNGEWTNDWVYVWSGFQKAAMIPIARLFVDGNRVCRKTFAWGALNYPGVMHIDGVNPAPPASDP